jgi:hypothetical protein
MKTSTDRLEDNVKISQKVEQKDKEMTENKEEKRKKLDSYFFSLVLTEREKEREREIEEAVGNIQKLEVQNQVLYYPSGLF